MIAQLRGTLVEKTPVEIVIDCGGVGYLVAVSTATSSALPDVGATATVLTLMIVREDAMQLYGFYSDAEREAFKLLISISGIGPKIAVSILSATTLAEFQDIILHNDLLRLQKLPGIGKKTAERIIIELRDKIGKLEGIDAQPQETLHSATQRSVREETLAALSKLGYQRTAADKAIRAALAAEPATPFSVEQLVRKALRLIAR